MAAKEFTSLRLDVNTHAILADLAKRENTTRAGLVRRLILDYFKLKTGKPPKIAMAEIDMAEQIVRHGVTMAFSDLNYIQQIATRIAQKYGVTIDSRKWAADIVKSLLPQTRQ